MLHYYDAIKYEALQLPITRVAESYWRTRVRKIKCLNIKTHYPLLSSLPVAINILESSVLYMPLTGSLILSSFNIHVRWAMFHQQWYTLMCELLLSGQKIWNLQCKTYLTIYLFFLNKNPRNLSGFLTTDFHMATHNFSNNRCSIGSGKMKVILTVKHLHLLVKHIFNCFVQKWL